MGIIDIGFPMLSKYLTVRFIESVTNRNELLKILERIKIPVSAIGASSADTAAEKDGIFGNRFTDSTSTSLGTITTSMRRSRTY